MTISVLETARAAYAAGIVAVPVREDGSKQPDVAWGSYQTEPPTAEEMKRWFRDTDRTGIGFVCGKVSGGLELLEFDEPDLVVVFKQHAVEAGLWDIVKRLEAGYAEATPGGGVHWLYRVEHPLKNTKLARKACPGAPKCMKHELGRPHVLIETRGEGGFVVVAPSHGKVHETGRPYVLYGLGVEHIPTLTVEERDALFALAQSLDQLPRPAERGPRPVLRSEGEGDERPGDDFTRRATWAEVLEPHGWQWVKRLGHLDYWRRPGKPDGHHSATTGQRGGDANADFLYVFTTSTEFDAERGYSKFAAYTILNYGTGDADFAAAARELRGRGYGGQGYNPDLSDLIAQHDTVVNEAIDEVADKFPEFFNSPVSSREYRFAHVFPAGHFVTEWIEHCAKRVDAAYEYHEAVGLAALAAATAGIKPRLSVWAKGLRTNLFVMLVGDSTISRKSTAIGLGEALLELVYFDQDDLLLPDQGSQEGIIERISKRNGRACAWLVPEFGQMLETMEKKQSLAGLKAVLLDVYDGKGYTHSRTSKRVKGESDLKDDSLTVRDPYLTVVGGTTDDVLQALSSRDIKSGLLPRFAYVWPESKPPYKDVEEFAQSWDDEFDTLVGRLRRIVAWVQDGLDVRFSPEAFDVLNASGRRLDEEASRHVILARLSAMGWKLAMLAAIGTLDRAAPADMRVHVTGEAARWAVGIQQRWRASALRFGMGVGGDSPEERHFNEKCERVVGWLEQHGGKAPRRTVARALRLRARDADEIERTLADQGLMGRVDSEEGPRVWVLV